MHHSTLTYPASRVDLSDQHLISHAGLSAVGGLLNAVDSRALCEDRFPRYLFDSPVKEDHRNCRPTNPGMVFFPCLSNDPGGCCHRGWMAAR